MSKIETVKKTYGFSGVTTIIMAIVIGIVGALITTDPFRGFLAGLAMTMMAGFIISLASLIPFVGAYFYWIWSIEFYHWFLGLVFTGSNLANMITLSIFPLIVFAIFGVLVTIVMSVIVVFVVGAILGNL
jgi:hypothetical protein